MQMQIHLDSGGSPGAIVSDQYVSQLAGMGNGTATPTFLFTNGTALAANTNYWIVLTSEASANIKWHSTVTQNTTQSIELSAGLAVAANAAELIPPDQVPNYVWNAYPTANVVLSLAIDGCLVGAQPSPEASSSPTSVPSQSPAVPSTSVAATATALPTSMIIPSPTLTSQPTTPPNRTPQASASATPVALTPITANVTSSFDSAQTALNLTAPASTLSYHHLHTATLCGVDVVVYLKGSDGTSGVTQPGVTVVSQFSGVQVGNRTLPPPAIQGAHSTPPRPRSRL
jgi:hypothetical protein